MRVVALEHEILVAERERLFAVLETVSYLQPLPSQTNFILCNVLRGDAREIRDQLRGFGVFVRYFDRPMLQTVRGAGYRLDA